MAVSLDGWYGDTYYVVLHPHVKTTTAQHRAARLSQLPRCDQDIQSAKSQKRYRKDSARRTAHLDLSAPRTGSPRAVTRDRPGTPVPTARATGRGPARTHTQMEQAVATRHLIGKAMGILMGSHHLAEEQAFDVLRRYSQESNIKLHEVARQVCEMATPGIP